LAGEEENQSRASEEAYWEKLAGGNAGADFGPGHIETSEAFGQFARWLSEECSSDVLRY